MVMCFTNGNLLRRAAIAAALGVGALLAGCTVATSHISHDFGAVVKEDAAAQVSDPDARYAGVPAPGSNGPRAALAQDRYERDAVTKPSTAQTSSVSAGGGGSGGSSQ